MAIPTFDLMLRPLLALACERDITRRDARPAMERHFNLSEEERAASIRSGETYVSNRTGWAMTFLSKGGLIEKVSPRTYRATERGKQFLSKHPKVITVQDLRTLDGWDEAWQGSKSEQGEVSPELPSADTSTPLEIVDRALITLNQEVKSRLLAKIIEQPPVFFEHLVLDVLQKMGYGGFHPDSVQHTGRSGDEGIDGRINQDALGLDQILVQAKRYKPENVVDRKDIQAFIGSMTGQGVTKGVFITTSRFNGNASEFVQRGSNIKLVLIDGPTLLDLMLEHRIGVRVEKAVEVVDLDQNYFEEE